MLVRTPNGNMDVLKMMDKKTCTYTNLGKMHGALGCQLPKKEPFPLQRNLGHLVGMDLKGNFGNF